MFSSEANMSLVFQEYVKKKILNKKVDYACEVDSLDGIPDYVLFEKTEFNLKYIVSFELKLKNWKQAMRQAFRYKLFSHESYVLMPLKNINPALKNIEDFKKYNIGLATINDKGELEIIYRPLKKVPISFFYYNKFEEEMFKTHKISRGKKKLQLWRNLDKVSILEQKLYGK